MTETSGELVVYTDPEGSVRVHVRLDEGSVWLSQGQMAELYGTTPQNITQHLRAIYREGEQDPAATCKSHLQVRREGAREVQRSIKHYNLPVILAVGFRVRSAIGTRFRQWATAALGEYVVKGFALDDRRLKTAGDDYFDELLARVRDIRSSERVFWRKVLDIYATSVDYDPSAEASRRFFQTVQNKMHWASHGHTAAEVIAARADASAPNMGLTSWPGDAIRKADVAVAKNYLVPDEIETLNRVVSAYLDFAELQAMNRRPMTMDAWVRKLDDFLRLSEREVLTHAGAVSAEAARLHAEAEFERWRSRHPVVLAPVDLAFEAAVSEVRELAKSRPRLRNRNDED
ncbi:MAG: virulence RhuM family protein [Myxococcales bacterium]|nr:virulence RhuM family protein [Myxococcales bacterium]